MLKADKIINDPQITDKLSTMDITKVYNNKITPVIVLNGNKLGYSNPSLAKRALLKALHRFGLKTGKDFRVKLVSMDSKIKEYVMIYRVE